jgi:hypothetical protein
MMYVHASRFMVPMVGDAGWSVESVFGYLAFKRSQKIRVSTRC